jgi:ketosteroid isomerase-like protein
MVTTAENSSTRTAHEVVSEAYAAAIAGDSLMLFDLLADDAVLEEPAGHPALEPGHSGVFRGKTEIAAAFAALAARLGPQGLELKRLVSDDEVAIGILEATCTDSAGSGFSVPFAEAWWVEGGLVKRIRPYYFDVKTLAERVTAS